MVDVIGVSFSDSNKIYYFLLNGFSFEKGDFVIVETERGQQFGTVVTDVITLNREKLLFPLKEVIRLANKSDININENNIIDAVKALEHANKFVLELDLDMKILNASFNFDRSQLLFNFLADDRVDFRNLAKKLAFIYKTRIELRQIGVRDKAKEVGGFGPCGQKLCCSSFLKDLNSVSINMAKNQNLALNPQKINGVCGRLMCCLGFENDCYNEYKKDLPRVGMRTTVNNVSGKVIYVDLFKKMYKVELEDGKIVDVNV